MPARLFAGERLTPSAIGLAWVLVLLAYLYQGIVPAFNADDIMQMQNPQDALEIIKEGRWGYYFIFGVLMHTDPLPLLSTVLGTVCLVGSAVLAARLLAFRFAAAALVFILVASISIYYGDLFSYDSTRLAFPFGNLLAIAGLYGFFRGQRAVGIVLLALAPGFYPVASELAAAVLVAVAIRRLAWPQGDTSAVLSAAAALLASLVLYMLVTHVAYAALGLELNGRTRLDPLAAIHRFHEVLDLFRTHSMPLLARAGGRYLPWPIVLCASCLFVAAAALTILQAYRRRGAAAAALAAGLNAALLVTPYALIFASGGDDTPFSPRALYAFSTIHAVWGATLFDAALPGVPVSRRARITAVLVVAAAGLIVIGSAARITEAAFDEYLASQSDLLATNRIISRIDTMLAQTPNPSPAEIPIAVVAARPFLAGPRGTVATSRQLPWSREWIFHLVDRRFRWVTGDAYLAAQQAAQSHGDWPAADSVFWRDGVVVVVINK
ncbi:MAG TPA: glucosyltransferase domain-containing protein [Acetobacteraceae bacterium]|nr:glucosyltransferase domain-containing protein [Acetobacteraceae bacterium]